MKKVGIAQTFIDFVKILYTENTSTITNNGFFSKPIQIQRGLRHGCPLSLPLYVIHGKITTKNINHDETITGIKIPNYTKQIKLSQYADDSNFLLKEQTSAEKVINFFQKLNKASWAIKNFEKTKILPINTDQITYLKERLPHITIKEQHETIDILGITFCEGLKQTKILSWQIILIKMQKHIKKLSTRELSLMGKAIILNTLTLAKTAHLSNVFPIPREIFT